MKSILVGSDLSERSDRAVRRSLHLAKSHGATCHVIHVVDDSMPKSIAKKVRDDAEDELRRYVDAEGSGASVETVALIGDPLEVIPEQAAQRGAELLVLGIHRPRRFLDRVRESTMECLVRITQKPVLLVSEFVEKDYERVLAPLSFSPACAAALKTAHMVAPNATVTSFHALHLPFSALTREKPGGMMDQEMTEQARQALTSWRAKEGLSAVESAVEIVTGSLWEVLSQKIDTARPDLIALGAHTRSAMAAFTLGSFTADLVRDPPTDLLLAHP